MPVAERLNGDFQGYAAFDERPAHPVTGKLADYFWQRPDGVREPRWREAFPKCEDPAKTWYSVTEVSKLLGKSAYTVREWLKAGALKGVRPNVGGSKNPARGTWMISGVAIEAFLRGQGEVAPVPELAVATSAED